MSERKWTAIYGEPITLAEPDLPGCCRRVAVERIEAGYERMAEILGRQVAIECPSCGGAWELVRGGDA